MKKSYSAGVKKDLQVSSPAIKSLLVFEPNPVQW